MDITTLLSVVYAKISASTSTEEILILSKIAEKIKIGNVRIVTNYNDMFDNTYFKTGTLFFVESEEKIYYASGGGGRSHDRQRFALALWPFVLPRAACIPAGGAP